MKNTIITIASAAILTTAASSQTLSDTFVLTTLGATEAEINSAAGWTSGDLGAALGLTALDGITLNVVGSGGFNAAGGLLLDEDTEFLSFTFSDTVVFEAFGNDVVTANENIVGSGWTLSGFEDDSALVSSNGSNTLINTTGANVIDRHQWTGRGTSFSLTYSPDVASGANYNLRISDTVPEPSSAALLGLGGLALLARRKRA